jgi:hypothetical protein
MTATKQGQAGPITKTTTDPDKKEFKDAKIEGTKGAVVTCEDVIAEMRKKGKKI